MATETFTDILDTPSNEVERPKPLPVGTYHCIVQGLPEHGKSAKKQTPFVKFNLKPIKAEEDVDEAELEEMGGFTEKSIPTTYYTTPDALWRLKEFLDDLGVPDKGTIRSRIDNSPNKEVLVTLRHEASQDGKAVFAQVAGTAAV